MSLRHIVLAATGLCLAACSSAPADKLTWRDVWNLVVVDESGLLVDAQLIRSNTGLLRGQGHLNMTVFPTRDSAVVLYHSAPPQAVTVDPVSGSLRLMQNGLEHRDDGGWTLNVREGREALDATFHLTPAAPEIPPVTLVEGQRQWALGVPVSHGQVTGAWRAGHQGGLIQGHGVLVRQNMDTWPGVEPRRSSLYLISADQSIGVEMVGERSLAWLATDGEVLTSTTVTMKRQGRQLELSLEPELPVTAKIRVGVRSIVRETWGHLLPFERWLVRIAAGWPLRSYERGRAQVSVRGEPTTTPALLVHDQPPSPKRRRGARANAGE